MITQYDERGKGVPLNDAERVARHYGVSIDEAYDMLARYGAEELLPDRGAGLVSGRARGIGQIGVGTSFWESLKEFVKAYPWQTTMVMIGTIAIIVNIKSTRRLVESFEMKRKKGK